MSDRDRNRDRDRSSRKTRPRRSVSRSRGERPKSPRRAEYWKPNSRYLEGYQHGFRQGSFEDGAQQGFDAGYHARRILTVGRYDTDDDYEDEIADRENIEMKRHDIMDEIEKLTQPGEKLTKENLKRLVNDYRESGEQDSFDEDEDTDKSTDEDTDEDTDSDEDEDTDTDEDTEDDEDKSNTDSGNTVASKSISILKGCLRDDDDAEYDDTNDDEITDKYTEEDDEWREWWLNGDSEYRYTIVTMTTTNEQHWLNISCIELLG